jgi:hypothetical protein
VARKREGRVQKEKRGPPGSEAGNVIETHEHAGEFKERHRAWSPLQNDSASKIPNDSAQFSPMTPLLSDSSSASDRIKRNNSVKYYGKIPFISR